MSTSANGTGSERGWPLSGIGARTHAPERSSGKAEPARSGGSRMVGGFAAGDSADRASSPSSVFADAIGPEDDSLPEPGLLEAIAESGARAEDFVLALLPSGQLIGIERNSDEEVEVYARSRRRGDTGGIYTGRYRSFRFDCRERRWIDGKPPPGARQIRNILLPLLEIGRASEPGPGGARSADLRPIGAAAAGEFATRGDDPTREEFPFQNLLPAPSPPRSEPRSYNGGTPPGQTSEPETGSPIAILKARLLHRARELLCRSRAGRRWLGVPRQRPREIVILRDLGP